MKANCFVRRIDSVGRIMIPKDICNNMNLKNGDLFEILTNCKDNEIIIRPFKKSFEQCAIDWFDSHRYEMNNCIFRFEEEYTFCITRFIGEVPRAGYAKRFKSDECDPRIGKVASYARAMGRNLNKMIGYED
jgi:AbrB family looped-hinge helix DNA binding protein